jgi:hypothetical protein
LTAIDHLAVWQRIRERVPWRDAVPHPLTPVRALHDGYARFAAGRPSLLAAYEDVRREVSAGAVLTPEALARWNGITRGVPAPGFRLGTAYAKGGRDRYGLRTDTERRFADCVAQAADRSIPVTARAARIHLDVAFFHPYDDGNARLGGLAMQFVLLSEEVELDEVRPLLTVVRRADDAEGAAGLARMVHGVAAATRRRGSAQRAGRPVESE